MPFANWRGQYDFGEIPAPGGGPIITFPGSQAASYGSYPLGSPGAWWGSLAPGSQDGSGYQYRRNRYYDPTTGRFTQEDPLGLAGGMNAYALGNGDPVNYVDPFGTDGVPTWLRSVIAGCSFTAICTQTVIPIIHKYTTEPTAESEPVYNAETSEALDGVSEAIEKLKKSQEAVRDMTNGLSEKPVKILKRATREGARTVGKDSGESGAVDTAEGFFGALLRIFRTVPVIMITPPQSVVCQNHSRTCT